VNSRQRLEATLTGKPVDRVPVNFYEVGGFDVDPDDPDPYNVYNAPTWRPLLDLAEGETDLIRMRQAETRPAPGSRRAEFFETNTWEENGSRFTRLIVRTPSRVLTSTTRRDPQVDTIWEIEHLLKDAEDLKAYLSLPDEALDEDADVSSIVAEDARIGDRGLVMINTGDPICAAAALFSMDNYILMAFTEPELFHALLEKLARPLYRLTEQVAKTCPGHLWRVFGPEYATEPYLPTPYFEDYVVRYTESMVRTIQAHGGHVRLHCHGRIRNALPYIVGMGVDAIDPIEPEPQGDVDLAYVRREYGKDIALFGNIEVSDIETLAPADFEKIAARAVEEGASSDGRGFCLMPTAAPYGREITPSTLANYQTMIRLTR
jgi:uroporphyrinogen-III decarboxylase